MKQLYQNSSRVEKTIVYLFDHNYTFSRVYPTLSETDENHFYDANLALQGSTYVSFFEKLPAPQAQ